MEFSEISRGRYIAPSGQVLNLTKEVKCKMPRMTQRLTNPLVGKGHSPVKSGLPPLGIAKRALPPVPAGKALKAKGKGWGLPR